MRLFKSFDPTARHQELKNDIAGVVAKYPDMSEQEVLAMAAQVVGMLVAMQNQFKMTPDEAMTLVARNIEIGNRVVIDNLSQSKGNS